MCAWIEGMAEKSGKTRKTGKRKILRTRKLGCLNQTEETEKSGKLGLAYSGS